MQIDYRKLCLNEKMGVIARVFQEEEIYNVSKIVNDFMNKILKNPNEQYSNVYNIQTIGIKIKYIPTIDTKINGKTNGNTIYIYLPVSKQNYYKVKYTIIHELLHVIQLWYDDEYINMSYIEQIKFHFRKPYLIKLSKLKSTSNYRKFIYLLYREDLYEIYAWAHDAYINAFMCKLTYKDKSNQTIANIVLKNIFLNREQLEKIINTIKIQKRCFNVIIEILISHFSELDGNTGQRFFDKEIFELDIIKLLRKNVKNILDNIYDPNIIVKEIKKLIKLYNNELLVVKDQILKSYIEHLKYWYDKAIKQYSKAIQLGIDDATPNTLNKMFNKLHKSL